jgi:poly(A) polymerase
LAALRRRILDTPAAPEVSFGDDPLRMLRAARFVSQLQFTVSDRVRAAITAMAPELARITVERVAVELDKMLLGADPVAGIDLMVQTGMGEVVLPEIGGMQMAIDEHHQHKDVYQHSLTVLRQAIARIRRAGAQRLGRKPAGPIWCCGGLRCCMTSASRPPAATSRTAG